MSKNSFRHDCRESWIVDCSCLCISCWYCKIGTSLSLWDIHTPILCPHLCFSCLSALGCTSSCPRAGPSARSCLTKLAQKSWKLQNFQQPFYSCIVDFNQSRGAANYLCWWQIHVYTTNVLPEWISMWVPNKSMPDSSSCIKRIVMS